MSHADEIKAFLDRDFAAETAFLAELVKVPSDNPPGDCAAHAARTAELLEGLGYTVERDVVPADQAKANGMISAVNLIVRRRFGDGPVVALNAHGDVVPPGEGWTKDPYGAEVVDGWMYGRGVAVSKSDIASYTWALRALEASGAPLAGTVELHFTYDEEAGGNIGPGRIMRKGLARRVSSVPGIGAAQMTVGLIKGGINTNVVPDRITFRLDRRMIPEERPAEVEAELRQVVAEAAEAFPKARVEVRRILLVEPLALLPGGERLAELLCRHATAVMGETVRSKGVPLYTDAPHYASRGVPTVLYGAGPHNIEEANAHRADERLPLSDLRKATEVIALTLLDLLGPH